MNQTKRIHTPRMYSSYSYRASAPLPKRRSYSWFVPIIALAAVGVIGSLLFFDDGSGDEPKAVLAATTVSKKDPPKPLEQPKVDAMQAQINQVIAKYPSIQIGVAITDLNTSNSYNYGVSAGFIGASTAKIITASLYMNEVEQGKRSLSDRIGGNTAQYQIEKMIVESDNTAWAALNTELTKPALQAWANHLGLTSYDSTTNILSAKDMATLLTKLYKDDLLQDKDKQIILGYMQKANRTDLIEASIPSGVKIYHKAGWLDDRIHDAAIIDDGKRPYVLVVFSKSNTGYYDQAVGQNIFRGITDASVQAFLK